MPPVASDDQSKHRDRVQARGGQRHPAQHQYADRPGREPDDGTPGELPDHLGGEQGRMRGLRPGLAEQGHRKHGRRVVEPGLAFQHPGQLGRQRELAQHREHGRRIGRGQDRAQQKRIPPAETRQPVDHGRQDQDAYRHPGGGQQHRCRTRGPRMRPVRGQAALGQDQHERAEAQNLR
jgi:hypothetical protein